MGTMGNLNIPLECGESVVSVRNYCAVPPRVELRAKKKGKEKISLRPFRSALYVVYFPKITQSPCDVAMKNNIGSDNQAFVREAKKACRGNSGGAAGPVPAVAAIIRLLLGQIMPQTLSNIRIP